MAFSKLLSSRFLTLSVLAIALTCGAATAADKPADKTPPAAATSAADPDPAANPVLASIMKLGTQVYYLGSRGGLEGWLIVKNSQLQIAYALPNSQNLIIGALFGPSGENISSAQIERVFSDHPDLKNTFTSAAQAASGMPATAGNPMAAAMAARAQAMTAFTNQAAGLGAASIPTLPATAPLLASPGERLMQDVQKAATVTLGNPSAPQILIVMDPTCPHCKATWKMLRDKVIGNSLQIRLIVISRNADDAEEERAAAQLLHVANPLETWDKYVDGDKAQLAGTPDASLLQSVRANHTIVDGWHIQHTPFLVYRGKDGKVKIVEGEPTNVQAILSDLTP